MFAKKFGSLVRNARGVAAIEFALIAPILLLGLVAMVDVARAIGEKFEMDQIVRSAVQLTLVNITDPTRIEASFRAGFPGDDTSIAVNVNEFCECGGTTQSCTTTCGGLPPDLFVSLQVDKTYDAILLPDIPITSTLEFRIR